MKDVDAGVTTLVTMEVCNCGYFQGLIRKMRSAGKGKVHTFSSQRTVLLSGSSRDREQSQTSSTNCFTKTYPHETTPVLVEAYLTHTWGKIFYNKSLLVI